MRSRYERERRAEITGGGDRRGVESKRRLERGAWKGEKKKSRVENKNGSKLGGRKEEEKNGGGGKREGVEERGGT